MLKNFLERQNISNENYTRIWIVTYLQIGTAFQGECLSGVEQALRHFTNIGWFCKSYLTSAKSFQALDAKFILFSITILNYGKSYTICRAVVSSSFKTHMFFNNLTSTCVMKLVSGTFYATFCETAIVINWKL